MYTNRQPSVRTVAAAFTAAVLYTGALFAVTSIPAQTDAQPAPTTVALAAQTPASDAG